MKLRSHASSQKEPAAIAVNEKMKKHRNHSHNRLTDKNIMQKIFHPDYILFDWEYFSRELEFE